MHTSFMVRNAFRLGVLMIASVHLFGSQLQSPALSLSLTVQSKEKRKEKPKRPKFGSSLKKLRWDSSARSAVEQKQDRDRTGEHADGPIKLETLYVVFDAVVQDKQGNLVKGLTKEDFAITEDGQSQEVATLALGDGESLPRSIVLIFDWSGSQTPYLETSVAAAKTLIDRLRPNDELAIVSQDVRLLADFTTDNQKLKQVLDSILKDHRKGKHGKSFQFSSLFATLRELTTNEETRPIIIFQTDGDEAPAFRDQPDVNRFEYLRGDDPLPEYGLGDIYDAAERSRATIYSVITMERLIDISDEELNKRGEEIFRKRGIKRPEGALESPELDSLQKRFVEIFKRGQQATSHVATLTGGWVAWLERPDQAASIYDGILSDINSRYLIGYYPMNAARDGKLRKVKIEVRGHPEYKVHGRNGYFAPNGK
jgi:VWFA-related protein